MCGLALILAWAPMPFGSIVPWSETLLYVAFGLLLAVAAIELGGQSARAIRWPALGLLALGALGFLQSLAWPRGWLQWLSPEHVRLADGAAGLLSSAPGAVRLSLAPWASVSTALTFLGVAMAMAAGAAVGRERMARRAILGALVLAGVLEAFVGAQLWFARSRTIWGVEVPTQSWRLHGSFVNPDHLASYLEIVLAACSAWAWWAWRRGAADARVDRRLLLLAPPALIWVALFLALAFTGSRAGMLGAVAGLMAQGVALAWRNRRFAPAIAGTAVAVLGLLAVAGVGLREGLGRFAQAGVTDVSLGARVRLSLGSLTLLRRFPLFGTGLGSFPEAFPLVAPPELAGATWTHAHDDPAELLATGGLAAGLCGLFVLGALLRRLWRSLQGGARSEDRAAALACIGALASLGLHELGEFGLTVPATSLTLAVICGAAAAVPLAARAEARRRGPA